MYGVVNKAVEDLVVSTHGAEKWEAIKTKAGVDVSVFISNEPYPDDVTYKLVGAACDVLGASSRDILIAFGEHWVLKTGLGHYGALMRSGGNSLSEFLVNLPHFHTRIQLIVQVDTRSDRRRELAVVASSGVAFLTGLKLT
jgi:hypothetical protein